MARRKSKKRTHQQFTYDYDYDGSYHYENGSSIEQNGEVAEALPEGIHHYEHSSEMPSDIRRYESNRLFLQSVFLFWATSWAIKICLSFPKLSVHPEKNSSQCATTEAPLLV